jgi:hypothetical protein
MSCYQPGNLYFNMRKLFPGDSTAVKSGNVAHFSVTLEKQALWPDWGVFVQGLSRLRLGVVEDVG